MTGTVATAFVGMARGFATAISGRIYPAGDVPESPTMPYATYDLRACSRPITHDRHATGRVVDTVGLTVVAEQTSGARDIASKLCSGFAGGFNNSGKIRCTRIISTSDNPVQLEGREKPLFTFELLVSVSYSASAT